MFGSQQVASKDMEVSQSPADAVSSLSFSPQADFLAASSWDNQTRVYEIQGNGASVGKASIQHDAPSLSCCWSADGSKVFSVGCDKTGKMLDLQTNQTTQVAAHDAPIISCRYITDVPNLSNMLVTGSWDKTVKYWDLRSPTAAHTLSLPDRCYAIDVKGALMVVGTAERHILIYNLNQPSTPYKSLMSTLKYQTRVVSCFPDASGYAVGTIEGRVTIEYVEEKDQGRKFSFKCHRIDNKNVYPINSIAFHPQYGTFCTGGGDGGLHFWDKDSKRSLKVLPVSPSPITCSAFNRNGSILAYGIGYDWHKGHEHANSNTKNTIMLHSVSEEDNLKEFMDNEVEKQIAATFSDMKKKKKKKVVIVTEEEEEMVKVEVVVEAEIIEDNAEEVKTATVDPGLAMFGKKKKKKKTNFEDFEAQIRADQDVEEVSPTSAPKNVDAWASSTRDYTYNELLTRVFDILRQKNPEIRGEKKTYSIMPPAVSREGTKKTAFSNLIDIAKRLRRQPDHVISFLYAELGTSGSIDGSQRLIIKGKFLQKQIESVLKKYIFEYVSCKTCKSAETLLTKENRLFFVQCESCGSTRSVSAIKTGFQAQIGKRVKPVE